MNLPHAVRYKYLKTSARRGGFTWSIQSCIRNIQYMHVRIMTRQDQRITWEWIHENFIQNRPPTSWTIEYMTVPCFNNQEKEELKKTNDMIYLQCVLSILHYCGWEMKTGVLTLKEGRIKALTPELVDSFSSSVISLLWIQRFHGKDWGRVMWCMRWNCILGTVLNAGQNKWTIKIRSIVKMEMLKIRWPQENIKMLITKIQDLKVNVIVSILD